MQKKIRLFLVVLGIFFQLIVMILFGFTDFPISRYIYMAAWIACGILIIHVSDMGKAE